MTVGDALFAAKAYAALRTRHLSKAFAIHPRSSRCHPYSQPASLAASAPFPGLRVALLLFVHATKKMSNPLLCLSVFSLHSRSASPFHYINTGQPPFIWVPHNLSHPICLTRDAEFCLSFADLCSYSLLHIFSMLSPCLDASRSWRANYYP